jgi:hypothetical protein
MIAWQHDFSDFAFSNQFGRASTYDGTPEQQRNLYQCLSIATRACLANNAVVRRELPMLVRRGEPQEFTSHGTKAWDNILSRIKIAEVPALRRARKCLHKYQLPSQTMESYIIEKNAAWCDTRRLGKDCNEEDFMDTYVMPNMSVDTYMELRAFMTRHHRTNHDESWVIVREIIMSDPAAQSPVAPLHQPADITYVAT